MRKDSLDSWSDLQCHIINNDDYNENDNNNNHYNNNVT